MKGEILAALAALFWSVSVILIRISGLSVRPLPLTLFKSAVAMLCFAVAIPVVGDVWFPNLTGDQYFRLCVSAVLGISIADTMFVAALERLGASLQAIADCIYAPALAGVGYVMFGEILNSWEMAGGVCVVLGVAVGLSRADQTIETKALYTGVLLAAGAHIVMGVGILMVRDIYREMSIIWVSGFRFFVATWVLLAVAMRQGVKDNVTLPFRRRDLWKWMIPMSVLGPFMATIFWVGGFKYTTPGRAAIYNQLSTVFIVILARVILKEPLTGRRLLGLSLAIAGAIVVGTH
jgi:drug/metabolite transporter (DMT)-like permease